MVQYVQHRTQFKRCHFLADNSIYISVFYVDISAKKFLNELDTYQHFFFLLQRFNEPFNSDKVYFPMEIQVKLYRRVIYTFRKLLSEGSLVSY